MLVDYNNFFHQMGSLVVAWGALRQASLATLDALLSAHAAHLADADVAAIVGELAPLVSDADLHVAHLALVLARTVIGCKAAPMAAALDGNLRYKRFAWERAPALFSRAARFSRGLRSPARPPRWPPASRIAAWWRERSWTRPVA